MRLNHEIFYCQPGTVKEMNCRICGSKCNVNCDVYGPTNFASALGKIYAFQDVFVCRNAGKEWHEQALKLVLAIEEMPSKRLAGLMKQDLDDLLKENIII